MDIQELRDYIENNPNLISVKKSDTYPELYILKYKNKCFYENIWNCYIETCRGKVIDKDYNIIVNPFEKIYNYGIELNAPVLNDDEPILALRKFNGYMAAVSKYRGEIIVSSTGSLDSTYVNLAREMILARTKKSEYFEGITTLYEIVHSSDPHIIPEEEGIYYIGQRDNNVNSKVWYNVTIKFNWMFNKESFYNSEIDDGYSCNRNVFVPKVNFTTLGKLKEHVKDVKHEGFVFYTLDGKCAKIKSPYYLTNKFLVRKSPEKLIDILKADNYKKYIKEEFYTLCKNLKENIKEFSAMNEQDRLQYIRRYFDNI